MDAMDIELWSSLPSELVERILAFLPAPVLCRFRTVCKRWNSLICTPAFGALCMQNASNDTRFIVLCEELEWCFLDVSAKRWYIIRHDRDTESIGRFRDGTLAAMDGGLVCLPLIILGRDVYVYVSSPTSKLSQRLPYCAAMATSTRPVLDMVVDSVTLTYKIFLLPDGAEKQSVGAQNPFMLIYESATNLWRNATIHHTPLLGFRSRATCSVVFGGLLYVLMSPFSPLIAQEDCLWSYNDVEDAWKNSRVQIPHIRSLHFPQLIVSGSRLYLASWTQKQVSLAENQSKVNYESWPWARDGWSYEISEVHLRRGTCSLMVEWTEAAMRGVLAGPTMENCFRAHHVKAFGCWKSIVLLCMPTGMAIVFDLRTNSWERSLPRKPLNKGHPSFLYGKSMNLLLPHTGLWEQLQKTRV